MTMKIEYRAGVTIGALIAASLTLSGCMGPTYGTDKTSTGQLIDDLGNIVSIDLLIDEFQDIIAATGKEIIDAKHLMAVFDQAVA